MHLQRGGVLTWNLWWCLVICGVIAITGGSPEGDPKVMCDKRHAQGSGYEQQDLLLAATRTFSSQQFSAWCWYKYSLVCLPCVHRQGHNCKPSYFLSYTTQAGKEAVGNPGYGSDINHLGKILMDRIIFQRESADPWRVACVRRFCIQFHKGEVQNAVCNHKLRF